MSIWCNYVKWWGLPQEVYIWAEITDKNEKSVSSSGGNNSGHRNITAVLKEVKIPESKKLSVVLERGRTQRNKRIKGKNP